MDETAARAGIEEAVAALALALDAAKPDDAEIRRRVETVAALFVGPEPAEGEMSAERFSDPSR